MLVTAVVGYTVAHARGAGLLRRRHVVAPRRGVRGLLQPVRAHVGVRDARRRARPAAGRSAGCRSSTPPPGTVPFVAVMIGTVTFDGLSQGSLWKDLSSGVVDALDGLGIGALTASKIASTFGLLFGVGLVGGFYRLGIEGARSVGGGLTVPQARERLRALAGADRGRLRRRALPHVPRLRGPGDHLPGLATPSARAGTSSAPSTPASTTRSSRRRTPGTSRSRWSSSATWRRSRSPTTAR